MIRHVTKNDLFSLSSIWYDNMALLQQSNPRIRLLPNARKRWEETVLSKVRSDDAYFLTYESKGSLSGFILASIEQNQPGLAPERIGIIHSLIIDLHSPKRSERIGSKLLEAVKERFVAQGVTHVRVRAATQSAVQQAFWRAQGAAKCDDLWWFEP